MTTMTIQVPESLEKEHDETVRFLAAKLYEAGKLSLGQAAEMCGMKKWDFPAVLAKFDIAYFQYTAEDVIRDADALEECVARAEKHGLFALTMDDISNEVRAVREK